MATLVFILDDQQEIVVPILGLTTLGCADGNDVVVDDPSIGARHAEIMPVETGGFHVRDVGSETGTFVNGRQVQALPLRDGDELAFGELQGRFVLDAEDWEDITLREQEAEAARQGLAEAQAAWQDTMAQHQQLLGEVSALKAERESQLVAVENSKAEAAALTHQASEQGAALGVVAAELASAQSELAKAKESLRALEQRHEELGQEVGRMNSETAARRQELADLQADLGAARATLQGTQGQHATIEEERQRLTNEQQAIQASLRQLKAEHARLVSLNAQAAAELRDTQSSLAPLSASLLAAQQHLAEVESKAAHLKAGLTAADARKLTIDAAVRTAKAVYDKLTKESQSLEAHIDALRVEEQKLTGSLESLRKRERQQLDEQRHLRTEFEIQLETRRRELRELEARLQASPEMPELAAADDSVPPRDAARKERITTVAPAPVGIVVRPKTSVVLRPRNG